MRLNTLKKCPVCGADGKPIYTKIHMACKEEPVEILCGYECERCKKAMLEQKEREDREEAMSNIKRMIDDLAPSEEERENLIHYLGL
jgi:hypothetical protein